MSREFWQGYRIGLATGIFIAAFAIDDKRLGAALWLIGSGLFIEYIWKKRKYRKDINAKENHDT